MANDAEAWYAGRVGNKIASTSSFQHILRDIIISRSRVLAHYDDGCQFPFHMHRAWVSRVHLRVEIALIAAYRFGHNTSFIADLIITFFLSFDKFSDDWVWIILAFSRYSRLDITPLRCFHFLAFIFAFDIGFISGKIVSICPSSIPGNYTSRLHEYFACMMLLFMVFPRQR